MSWLEKIFRGHHGGYSQGGHGRGHDSSHGNRGSHHGDKHARDGWNRDGRTYSSEEWGRSPGNTPAPQAEVACPKCNASNVEGSRFCSQCATRLAPQACSQCSQPLAAGTKFCSSCGTPVKS
ncbi:zinc ribbon domain-containing protein [Caballeronia sp. BR00000012568055]|uniref:zinc ribbon domain-containing protein n=1 Tax=Caballeronia sp. BR00000012568055 TaxID=2918761 RepID=UPI0034D76B30